MLRRFFKKRTTDKAPTDRHSQWQDLVMVIIAAGVVAVAIADKDFRQPFYVLTSSILSAHLIVKK
jgi:hypothetical protein